HSPLSRAKASTVFEDSNPPCHSPIWATFSPADEVPEYGQISYHSHPLPELPIFGNLLELEVSHGPRYSKVVLPQILQHLISKSPNLETLVFKGFPYCYDNLREFVQSPILTFSPSLKIIHVHDFSGSAKEEEMVLGFLRKAVGLQELKIIKKNYDYD
ncbi:hypothetical protein Dimus_027512, partial [Dionaea muscipula]